MTAAWLAPRTRPGKVNAAPTFIGWRCAFDRDFPTLALLSLLAYTVQPARAQDAANLTRLINDYRAAPQSCQGRQTGPAGPLAPASPLSRVHLGAGAFLEQALEDLDFPVARAQAMTITGPADAASAFAALVPRYCTVLLDPQLTAIGVLRNGNEWQLVLARPFVPVQLPAWPQAGQAILDAVNAVRAEGHTYGSQPFPPAPPLAWNQALGQAALAHSQDMASKRYFSHQGSDGTVVGDRALQAGYQWSRIGENIAAGLATPEQAVAGWLDSPLHCANLMNARFTEMGAAYALSPRSKTGGAYWTQVFGTRR